MLVSCKNLSRTYRQGDAAVHALRDVSLSIGPGELVAVTGPSGCGKTTLLGILGLLDDEFEGVVRFEGRLVSGLGPAARARLRLEKIGFVFQDFQLLPSLTTLENVALPRWHCRGDRREAFRKARELLRVLGMEHRLRHRPERLSGGEIQRAALARALVNDPVLVLADEPTAHLDELSARITLELLEQVSDAGRTVVVASHDPMVVRRARRCVQLRYGELEPAASRTQVRH